MIARRLPYESGGVTGTCRRPENGTVMIARSPVKVSRTTLPSRPSDTVSTRTPSFPWLILAARRSSRTRSFTRAYMASASVAVPSGSS